MNLHFSIMLQEALPLNVMENVTFGALIEILSERQLVRSFLNKYKWNYFLSRGDGF